MADEKKDEQKLKVHRIPYCTGFPWRERMKSRRKRCSKDLRLVTCGVCKQTIVHAIAKSDWSMLDDETMRVLEKVIRDIENQEREEFLEERKEEADKRNSAK